MQPNDTSLHLWFKPQDGVLREEDASFANNYGKRFYPRLITRLAQESRKMALVLTAKFANAFEYQMRHYTNNRNKRYVIEESLRDPSNENGFSLSIQNTNNEERKLFIEEFNKEKSGESSQLTPVMGVITYLQDSLQNEAHLWDNTTLHNGVSAIDVMVELITFLKNIKTRAKVYDFSLRNTDEGRVLTLLLVCPDTLSYYMRVDWTIV